MSYIGCTSYISYMVPRCFQWNAVEANAPQLNNQHDCHPRGTFCYECCYAPCYGFVTGQTSIPLPFYRCVTGVTAPEGGKGGIHAPANAYLPIFPVCTTRTH